MVEMTKPVSEQPIKWEWTLYVDGSSNEKGSGVVVILEGPNDIVLEYSLKFDFKATNNQAKCEALVVSLWLVKEVGVWVLNITSDS